MFVSEDGAQRKWFDLGRLDLAPAVLEELAVAFLATMPPLGTLKRLTSANNLWSALNKLQEWLLVTKPQMQSLAELTRADVTMLFKALGPHYTIPIRTLFKVSSALEQGTRQAVEERPHRGQRTRAKLFPVTQDEDVAGH